MRRLRSPWIIALVALALRIGATAYYLPRAEYHLATRWAPAYEQAHLAANLAAGTGFSSPWLEPTGPTAALPPGYPAILSLIFRLFGSMTVASARAAVALNLLLSAATCILIFYFGRKTVGETAAVIAAWIWALYLPVMLSAIFHLWDGTLATFLATAGYLAALALDEHGPEDKGKRAWLLYGVLWGVAVLVNPALVAIYGVLFLWACRPRGGAGQSFRETVAGALLTLVLMTAIVAPWTLRNYRIFHRFIPVRSNLGLELWTGNHHDADGFFHISLHPLGSKAELAQYRRRGEAGYMEWKQQLALEFMRTRPAEFLHLTLFRMSCFWGGVYDGGYAPIFLPTTLFGLSGLALLARRNRPLMWRFALPLIVYPVPYYLTHADLRFRFPIEPLLACLSGYAIVAACTYWRERKASKAALANL